MARNMTFSVSLKLLTKNFQNGVKAIQGSLARLRQQFSTFVGGIGLGLGIQELIENAKQLDKAQTTLRNVSGSMERYSENLKFVDDLSKRYNQDVITLMGNFAKFYSAAEYAGIELKDQYKIYESLTRAAAYFNLTLDETNGVMLAVQQMISKGRVSSEELRRQLGERLPGAMNLAAKAMGYGADEMGEFEKAIRLGAITADELLPKLADELNRLTQNLDVNTIQGLSNVLKNAFTELVQKLNVKEIYKSFLGGTSKVFKYIAENLKEIGNTIVMVLGTISGTKLINKAVDSWDKFFKKIENNLTKAITQSKIFKKELDDFASGKGIVVDIDSNGFASIDPAKNGGISIADYDEAVELAKQYNKEVKKSNDIQDQLNHKTKTMGLAIWDNIKKLKEVVALQVAYYAIAAAISIIATKLVSWWKEQKRIKNLVEDTNREYEKMANKLGADDAELESLKAKQTDDWGYSWEAETEEEREKRIKRINQLLGLEGDAALKVSDSNAKINAAIQKRLNLLKKERQFQAAKEISADALTRKDELTVQKKAEQRKIADYNAKIQELLASGGPVANDAIKGYGTLIAQSERTIKNIDAELAGLDEVISNYSGIIKRLSVDTKEREDEISNANTSSSRKANELEEEYNKIKEKYNRDLEVLKDKQRDGVINQEDYNKELKNLTLSTLNSIYALDDIDENTDEFANALQKAAKKYLSNEIWDDYKKIQKDYNNDLRALKEQYDDGLISQKDYNEAVLQLQTKTLESIYSLDNINENAEEFARSIKEAALSSLTIEDEEDEVTNALNEYKENVEKVRNQFANGVITQKELDEKLFDLLREVVTTIGSFSALSGAAEELANQYKAEKRKQAREKLGEIEPPKLGEYDSTFNYKKSNSEIYEDNADFIKDYAEQLERFIGELEENRGNFTGVDLEMLDKHIENLEEGLITLTDKAESFSEAAKFAKVQEDIKKLKGELAEGIFDNISGIATAAERLTNSWKTLTETMDDPDASGWEKFITIFTTIMSIIETVVGVIKAFQAVMAVAEGLSLATAAAEQAGIPVKVQDAIATKAQAAAAKELAVARHMAVAAGVPYPANIAAIGTTAGALAAAFAAIPQFASGGVVPGNSLHGDKILARLNSGELVLNKLQQASLWNALSNNSSGNVEFKLRGSELVGVLKNYNKKTSK